MAEVRVTQEQIYAELEGSGIYVTQILPFAEIGPNGVYVTQQLLFAEIQFVEPVIMPTHFPKNAGTRAMHTLLPDELTGYAFDPDYSWWAIVKAEASDNLVINPSFEAFGVLEYDDSGDWEDTDYLEFPIVGATAGRRCVRLETAAITESWFEYDEGIIVTPGPYTWSLDVYVTVVGTSIVLEIRDGVTIKARRRISFDNTGWQRVDISYVELGSGTVQLRLISPSSNPAAMYIYSDAWQFEAKKYATTYFDGDNIGFNDVRPFQSYYWHGEAHRSVSTRLETTGSGGRLVSLSDNIGFKTTSIVGLSLSPVDVEVEVLGNGEEINKGSSSVARVFTITGRIFAENYRRLKQRENNLMNLVRPNNTLDGEQIMVRFQETDSTGQLIGPPLDIVCSYTDGLQGNDTNFYQQSYALQFRASQPHLREVIDSSVELELYKTLVENFAIFKDGNGEYDNLGTGSSNGFPTRVGFLRNGSPAVFGPFTQFAGDTVSHAAYWNGVDWVQMGTIDADINDVDDSFRAGYDLVVGRQSGEVSVYNIALDTWADIGVFDGPIYAVDRDAEGNIWIAGDFVQDDAATTTFNNVAKYNFDTDTWETLGDGLTDSVAAWPDLEVKTVLATNDGYVYFGGAFSEGHHDPSTTTLANGAIRWDIANQAWDAMGAGFDEAPNQFVQGQDGYVYAVGPFSETGVAFGQYDLRGFARWNGHTWEEMFPLQRVSGDYGADGVAVDENGVFWFFAYTTTADDIFDVPGIGHVGHFGWKNGVFYPPFSTTSIQHMAIGPGNRTIYAVREYEVRDGYLVASYTEVDYQGTADAPLSVHLEGPGHPYSVVNLSTKGGVYFHELLELGDGEILTIRSDTQKPMTYSNMRDNMNRFLSAGPTKIRALRLRPGINRISIFMPEEDASNKAWAVWKNRYQTLTGPLDDE